MDENFKKKIIEDFGLEKMDNEGQEEMIERIGNLLFQSVVERSVDLMDESAMNNFDKVITEAGSDYQKVISFLKNNVSGFDKIVKEEMSHLKRTTSGIFR